MKMFKAHFSKNNLLTLFMAGLFFSFALALFFLSKTSPYLSLQYSQKIFPFFVNTIGRFFSSIPVSIFELLIYLGVFYILFCLSRSIYLLIKKKSKTFLLSCTLKGLLIGSVFFFLFSLNAGVNYNKPALFDGKNIINKDYSEKELFALYKLLLEDISDLIIVIDGDNQDLLSLDNISLNTTAIESMKNLQERFSELSGYYPKPKPILFSKGMSYLNITGIYSPFTLEANYNKNIPSYLIPFTVCHELAHLKGFMREEEANFIAYLACRDSAVAEFQYSGALNALAYTLNALYKTVDTHVYTELLSEIPDPVLKEYDNNRAFWKAHTKKISTVSTKVNDQYLKLNAQAAGVQSYGLMVQLLLEEYQDEF